MQFSRIICDMSAFLSSIYAVLSHESCHSSWFLIREWSSIWSIMDAPMEEEQAGSERTETKAREVRERDREVAQKEREEAQRREKYRGKEDRKK